MIDKLEKVTNIILVLTFRAEAEGLGKECFQENVAF